MKSVHVSENFSSLIEVQMHFDGKEIQEQVDGANAQLVHMQDHVDIASKKARDLDDKTVQNEKQLNDIREAIDKFKNQLQAVPQEMKELFQASNKETKEEYKAARQEIKELFEATNKEIEKVRRDNVKDNDATRVEISHRIFDQDGSLNHRVALLEGQMFGMHQLIVRTVWH